MAEAEARCCKLLDSEGTTPEAAHPEPVKFSGPLHGLDLGAAQRKTSYGIVEF